MTALVQVSNDGTGPNRDRKKGKKYRLRLDLEGRADRVCLSSPLTPCRRLPHPGLGGSQRRGRGRGFAIARSFRKGGGLRDPGTWNLLCSV